MALLEESIVSMIGYYHRVTADELRFLRSTPNLIAQFVYPEDDDEPVAEYECFDVDKAWQAIHFLLCGDVMESDPPLGNVVLGGTTLGEVDLGYGPARYLKPNEVRDAAKALDAISVNDLMKRFDYKAMVEAGALFAHTDATEDEERDYIQSHYPTLRSYFLEAANAGDGMLLWIG